MPSWLTLFIAPFIVLNVVIGLVTYATEQAEAGAYEKALTAIGRLLPMLDTRPFAQANLH